MCETLVLFSTTAEGLIEIVAYANVAEAHTCKTGEDILDVYLSCPFYITIASVDKVDVHLPKHQSVREAAYLSAEVAHNKYERYSYPPALHTNDSDTSVDAVHY